MIRASKKSRCVHAQGGPLWAHTRRAVTPAPISLSLFLYVCLSVCLSLYTHICIVIKDKLGTSLVAQWLRIHLPVQGTQIRALVWEDPTRHGATKPMCHNYWAREPQLLSPRATTTEARMPRARGPKREATAMRSPRSTMKSSPH